jgi:hypothetical protein
VYLYVSLELNYKREKQKLTLGIDGEVIERAKAAGINISAMTEELLKSVTYEPKGMSEDDVVEAYQDLFISMVPLIRKHNLYVTVGGYKESDIDGYKLQLYPCSHEFEVVSLIYVLNNTEGFYGHYDICAVGHVVEQLYTPKTILENLILEIVGMTEKNKQKVRELKLAKRFVEVLLSDIEKV